MIGSLAVDSIDLRAFGQPVSLTRPSLCPEIVLWLIADEVDLEAECRALHEGEPPPYWAFCWGSGQALARFLLDHPNEVAGRRVVDFGAGSGVAAIAAAGAGAASVAAVDVDAGARRAIAANAEANGVSVTTSPTIPDEWDVLLASDVLYERSLHAVIEDLRGLAQRCGGTLLVGEPDRPGNPGYPTAPLAEYEAFTTPDVDSPSKLARVYRLV
jgi:predicted nicotinamide N-methyase